MNERAIICAYDVAADGAAAKPVVALSTGAPPQRGFRWVHLNRSEGDKDQALKSLGNLNPLIIDELLSEETRPRTSVFQDGLLINLRAVNYNPGEEPEEFLALHMWLTPALVVTVADEPLRAVQDLRRAFDSGDGPRTSIEVLSYLAHRITDHLAPVVADLTERLDNLEETSLDAEALRLRAQLVPLRREALIMRRYVAPQREALMRLSTEAIAMVSEVERLRIREAANETTLFVEELDLVRERASLLNELIYDRRADDMNRTMVVLAVVTVIFLPLNLLAGLLGMNVHGIPLADKPWAFAGVCGVTFVLAGCGLWLFRHLRWI